MTLPAKVAETIIRRSLISDDDRILVAVSGGPDSIALLHYLHSQGLAVEAAHLNHQFRGEEADGDAQFVREFCDKLGVILTTESINVPELQKEQRISAQQAARNVRYNFLERVRVERSLNLIATAHNLDDRIETVLFNIIRGTGIDGLRGIPYRRGVIIRPLLDTPRLEVEAYCETHLLEPRTDSSNKSTKYARNNVRAELIPYLERRYNTGVRNSLLHLSELAADESDLLNSVAVKWVDGRKKIPVDDLLKEPVALQRRIIREWIRSEIPSELSDVVFVFVERFRRRLYQNSSMTLSGGRMQLHSDGVHLSVRELNHEPIVVREPKELTVGETALFGDYQVTVSGTPETVDAGSLYVRNWLDGDRIVLYGGTKKVQDVFTDHKVPRNLRRHIPLIFDKSSLIAVGDIALAARAFGSTVSIVKVD